MRNVILKLSGLFGPSGYEDAVRQEIRKFAAPLGEEIWEDGLGNLYVYKKGKCTPERPVVLAAYMDECGIMTKETDDEGFTRFGIVGDLSSGTILGKQVLVGSDLIHGVIGLKPFHLTDKAEREKLPKISELYVDAGFSCKAEAEKVLLPGELGVFYGPAEKLGTNLYGKAMGRSVGCAVLLSLMERELPVDVIFVFTVQHQVGSRGAMTAGHRLKAGTIITLDICPGADSGEELPVCGDGPVIPAMDRNGIYDKRLYTLLRRAAMARDVKIQPWGRTEVSGDGGAFMEAGMGAKTVALYCPAKYCTAPGQMLRPEDVLAMEAVLMGCLEEMAQ